MHLINLKITINQHVIRDIPFKAGLNIITNKKGVGRSGNSIGKSTLARVVDYLFMGPIDSIYIDEEFNKPNEKIELLLSKEHVVATLGVSAYDGSYHEISRGLSIRKAEAEFYKDGLRINENEYERHIQKLIFDVATARPSVRALSPKFIRSNSHKMLNRVLPR